METWHTRLRLARISAGLNQKQAANLCGISQPTYSHWESGEIDELKVKNLHKVCKVFGLTEQYLLYGKGPAPGLATERGAEVTGWEDGIASEVDIRCEVPLISHAQAGSWAEVVDPYQPGVSDEWIKTTAKISQRAYALRIRGDSMEPAIPDGSIIIVDPNRDPQNGQIVVVRQNHDSEATVKRLVIDGGYSYLKPDNPRYPIMQMADDAVFCGVAIEVTKSLV